MEKRIHHGIKVISAGPLLTIQDAGRYGYMAYGIGESGVTVAPAHVGTEDVPHHPDGEVDKHQASNQIQDSLNIED